MMNTNCRRRRYRTYSTLIRIGLTLSSHNRKCENILEIPLKVNVPPGAGPPIYPTSLAFEQAEQLRILAPPAQAFADDSASGVVSEGPVAHVPAEISRIQFTSLCRVAVVPGRVRGSQMYVEVMRFADSQRSPMYLRKLTILLINGNETFCQGGGRLGWVHT